MSYLYFSFVNALFNDSFVFLVMKSCILCGIDIELYVGLVFAVLGFLMQFEDDSLEFVKTVKQWNVKIISVSIVLHKFCEGDLHKIS